MNLKYFLVIVSVAVLGGAVGGGIVSWFLTERWVSFFIGGRITPGSSYKSNVENKQPDIPPTRSMPEWEIISIKSRITETNDVWWKHAWRLSLKNKSSEMLFFDATIEFQDKDGFIIDVDRVFDLVLPPHTEKVFTGSAMVDLPGARRVENTQAKVRQKN